jgi:nitrate reductase NapE component
MPEKTIKKADIVFFIFIATVIWNIVSTVISYINYLQGNKSINDLLTIISLVLWCLCSVYLIFAYIRIRRGYGEKHFTAGVNMYALIELFVTVVLIYETFAASGRIGETLNGVILAFISFLIMLSLFLCSKELGGKVSYSMGIALAASIICLSLIFLLYILLTTDYSNYGVLLPPIISKSIFSFLLFYTLKYIGELKGDDKL